jgi:uncharacterized membrane protein SpoIIM required for sporulation
MDIDRASQDYLRLKQELWEALNVLEASRSRSWKTGVQTVALFEELTSVAHRLRTRLEDRHPLRLDVEDFLASSAQRLLNQQMTSKQKSSGGESMVAQYRRIWRDNISLFLFTLMFFAASTLAGYIVVRSRPEFAGAILGQGMVEQILDNQRWFDSLTENPLKGAFFIALNNIKVSIGAFALSGLLGLGGIYILVFNGLMLGAVVAFCETNQFEGAILDFIASHGPLELSVIVVSVFAGLLFGRCFYLRPRSLIRKQMPLAAGEAFIVAFLSIPWLVLAAFFEGFLSPLAGIDTPVKIAWGVALAAAFWLFTFFPTLPTRRTL